MVVCDRCKKIARTFIYGDYINKDYNFADLCFDCTKELKQIIWEFRKKEIKCK